MKKKILSLWMALTLLLLPTAAFAANGTDLSDLDGEIDLYIPDVEQYEDGFRVSGTNDPFESAGSFKLPATITISNTSARDSGAANEPILEANTKEFGMQLPEIFTFELEEGKFPEKVSLAPGEEAELEGYLKFDGGSGGQRTKETEYTVAIIVESNIGNLWKETSFTITPVDQAQNDEYSWMQIDELDKVTDPSSAAAAVKKTTAAMNQNQKRVPVYVDLATLYAETAVSKAASQAEDSGDITVNAAVTANLASTASKAVGAVEDALSGGGVATARYLSKTVTFTTEETDISVQVDPDILTAQVDKIRVETPAFALTLKIADLEEDLTEPLTFKAQEMVASYALRKTKDNKTTVRIDLPKGGMTNPVTVSLPYNNLYEKETYQAVVETGGTASASKYNPTTRTMDGKINASGTYTVKKNEKNFTDITRKTAEMQSAILYLTSKGIINGTSATEFSPDKSISRQQIAALLMRALGKVDNTAETTFTDVPKSSSLYHAIASSQKQKVINGYSDNTFRGTNVISKSQIVTVSGRVLTSEMNYKVPSDPGTYLGKYSDTVPDYAKEMVALATREGLVVYRSDGTFSGGNNMTRGDAAIILYRLFQKIW